MGYFSSEEKIFDLSNIANFRCFSLICENMHKVLLPQNIFILNLDSHLFLSSYMQQILLKNLIGVSSCCTYLCTFFVYSIYY